jgi:D-serine deaminase-like pyridoxal phosphate-dependent protein
MKVRDLPTPSVIIDRAVPESNLAEMSKAWRGDLLRPHVQPHKSTVSGHRGDPGGGDPVVVGLERAA